MFDNIIRNDFTVLVLITISSFSCSHKTKEAPERYYSVEIIQNQETTFNSELATFLVYQIPQHKYTFTNQSGKAWPYYKALDLDETIAADSLMPPHWFLHRMIIRDDKLILKNGDHLIRIHLMTEPDTISNYKIDIYEMDSTGLIFTSTSGVHYVDTTEFSDRHSLFEYYLKSIIRYSFK